MATAPPSASGSLLLGATLELQRDQLGAYARAMEAHGDIDAVFAPDGARQVLAADSSHYVKDAPVIGEFRHFLGDGLLVSEGDRWLQHRRIAQPLFTRKAVSAHLGTVAAAAADLVSWCEGDAAAQRPIDVHALGMRYALHALGTTVFGDDIVHAAPVLRRVLPPLGNHLKRRSLSPVRSPHWLPLPANRRAEQIRRTVWGLADSLIAERRRTGGGGSDLLSRLLAARDVESGAALDDDSLRDEAIIFLIAGHETTGSALAFTLWLLGRHQDVQDAVRVEVAGLGAGADGPVEIEQVPYTHQVIAESMRLYPPAHTVVRRASADTELLGYPVRRGRIMAVNIWGIHHRPSIWDDPFRFDPGTFAAGGAGGRSRRSTSTPTCPSEVALGPASASTSPWPNWRAPWSPSSAATGSPPSSPSRASRSTCRCALGASFPAASTSSVRSRLLRPSDPCVSLLPVR